MTTLEILKAARARSEYRIWANIVQRCENPNNPNYARYGGAGIRLCAEWRASFRAFFDYVGERPSPTHSIDRIDWRLGYQPGNVRWATPTEQAQNKAQTIWITYQGETRCLSEWSRILNKPLVTLYNRLERGWSHDKTLSAPCAGRGGTTRKLSHAQAEEIRALRRTGARGIDVAERFGVTPNIISRIHVGKTYAFDRAIAKLEKAS